MPSSGIILYERNSQTNVGIVLHFLCMTPNVAVQSLSQRSVHWEEFWKHDSPLTHSAINILHIALIILYKVDWTIYLSAILEPGANLSILSPYTRTCGVDCSKCAHNRVSDHFGLINSLLLWMCVIVFEQNDVQGWIFFVNISNVNCNIFMSEKYCSGNFSL